MYIFENRNWPNFQWDTDKIYNALIPIKFKHGQLLGRMMSLGFDLQGNAALNTLTREIIKTNEIEGEHLDVEEVRSSVARHLGMDIAGLLPTDRRVDGIVEMILDATRHYQQKLTLERLYHWHVLMFPTGMSGFSKVQPGAFRQDQEGPMQVVSGGYGREKVHFQAPPAHTLMKEVREFLKWFNGSQKSLDPLIKAGIAHLWFVTLHPFDDGNGRIARAVTDLALARAEDQPQRFYSMSTQIQLERKSYYQILETTQKSDLDITKWLLWFLSCLLKAIEKSQSLFETITDKSKFWEQYSAAGLNSRQIQMLNILFDGFKGKLNSSKWAKMMKCSQDTANRDINELLALDILIKSEEGGRSTHYTLKSYSIYECEML